jgi:diamine N-acetyltransferase
MRMKNEEAKNEWNADNHSEDSASFTMNICRVSSQQEIEQVAALAEEIWHEHYEPIIGSKQVDYMIEKFQSVPAMQEQMEKEGYEYYSMITSDGLAGYFAFRKEPEALFLSKLYIAKSYRGRGYARKAMDYMEDYCRTHFLTSIWLTVNRYNTNSIERYERIGFHKIRTQIADIGEGYVMDDYIMEKRLAE